MNMRRILNLAVGVSVLASACAPSVTTIDRTQPNALAKSQFEGIWYYRAMVTEADPEAGDTEGITSNMDKIRWEIREDNLIGYRSYEFLPYAEGLTDEGRDFFGAPVVGYKILSHFDIQRDYSPTTGVETNVIVENTTDRPWHERQYIRVDWSKNIVGTPTKFWTGWSNYPDAAFSADALTAYYTQGNDETDPERPWITQDYMDITNRFSLAPDPYFCGMMLLNQSVPRCGGGNVKVRLSFRKVDPNDDYEPLYYPDVVELKDNAGNAIVLNGDGRSCEGRDPSDCFFRTFGYDASFGNFRILRVAFDQERFLTRTGRIYQAGRFNIWEKIKNEDGSTIAPEQRTPRPIIYYGNVHFPADIVPGAQKLSSHWNKPFQQVVAYQKGYLVNGQPDTQRLRDEMGQDMFQFRVNDCNVENIVAYARANGLESVIERVATSADRIGSGNVENVCAAVQYEQLKNGATLDPKVAAKTGAPLAFTWQRKGDLRYNFQNYIEQVQVYGPWGVAQFAQDPESGEFIGANLANYFGVAGDSVSQRQVDLLQWMNGDLSEEELFRGDTSRTTVASRRTPRNNAIRSDLKQALFDHESEVLSQSGDRLFEGDAEPGAEDSRFRRMFQGTDIEREILVNEDILRSFAGPTLFQPVNGGAPTGTPNSPVGGLEGGLISDAALAAASPVNWGMTPNNNEYMKAAYELGKRAYDLAEFFDPNTSGMADFFKGRPRDEIYQALRVAMYESVNSHEVGHTVGLRHNFEASMDALNYHPDFWRMYWNNPPTEQNKHRGNELKYASIMDYGFDVSLEGLSGIGGYDEAAIRFIYGQLVDVWDTSKVSVPDPRKYKSFARRCGHDNDFWGLGGMLYYLGPDHLPRLLSVAAKDQSACAGNYDNNDTCDTALDVIYRDMVTRMEADVSTENRPSDCFLLLTNINELMAKIQELPPDTQHILNSRKMIKVSDLIAQKIEVMDNPPEYDDPATAVDEAKDGLDNDLCRPGETPNENGVCPDGVADDKGFDYSQYYTQVPYGYCSDLYANFSNPFCQRWDTGWDFLESTQAHINRWDRDYIFDHFRRDAFSPTGWGNPRAYMARLLSRRFFHMTNVFRYYLYTRRSLFEAPRYDDWQEAAYAGLNFLERVIQDPEPGTYCLDTASNKYVPKIDAGTCNQELVVPMGAEGGRYLNNAWTDEYFYKSNRIGVFYDKLAAIWQITTSSGFFARDLSDLFDRRSFSLGYPRVYLDPMMQRFAALITGDHTGYRPRVVTDDGSTERYVRYTPFFDEQRADGSSVRQWLETQPEIEPAWSWSLRYFSLAYAMANWSSVNDYAPEYYRMTKVSIRGTPEDVDYPSNVQVREFTDPETLVTYRAPVIAPLTFGSTLRPEFPAYYGDAAYKRLNKFRNWSVGSTLLEIAENFRANEWQPAKDGCDDGTLVGTGANDRWATREEACVAFEVARQNLNEQVGFIDRVRKFNIRAEGL